jgi:hypothetical protein
VNAQPKDVPFAIAATSDLTSLWNVDRARAERIGDDAAGLAAALAPSSPRRVVLVKAAHWHDLPKRPKTSPEERAILESARVLWEKNLGGGAWVLVT